MTGSEMAEDRLLPLETIQARLGGVSRTTAFALLERELSSYPEEAARGLRSIKVGRRRMVPESELRRYMATGSEDPLANRRVP